jgi:hypothetical protein
MATAMKSDQVSSHSLEGLAPFTISILMQLYRPPLVLKFQQRATNILTLTAVLMGLRNIGNFFCHIFSIQRILSRDGVYDASSMLYSPNFLPWRGCSYLIWRALNKRWHRAEKNLIIHSTRGLRYHATIAEKSSGCQ